MTLTQTPYFNTDKPRLFPLLKEMGFFIMFADATQEDIDNYNRTKELLGREDVLFTPQREYVCERPLSHVTYLYIEAYYSRTRLGERAGFVFDFYKARYVKGSKPSGIKIYGLGLSYAELVKRLTRFEFLRKDVVE